MSSLRIAALQMQVTADLQANFARIRSGIESAASKGAQMIALPECALSGYPPLHHFDPSEIDVAEIAALNDEVCGLARANGVWVVLGTIIASEGGILNSALVISRDGSIAGRYDKLHLIGRDNDFFAPGNGVPVFEIDGIPFGALICYDARFPEPFRYLRDRGARFIVNISNACGGDTWKQPVLEGTYRTRASENSCFVVAVNAAGPLQMATSRICDPLGLDLASANVDREEMILAEMDLSQAETGYYDDRRTDQFEVVARFQP